MSIKPVWCFSYLFHYFSLLATCGRLSCPLGFFVPLRHNVSVLFVRPELAEHCELVVLCPIHTADATKLFCRVGVGVVNTPVGSRDPVYNFLC